MNSERTCWVLAKSLDLLDYGDRPGNKSAASFNRHELPKAEWRGGGRKNFIVFKVLKKILGCHSEQVLLSRDLQSFLSLQPRCHCRIVTAMEGMV